MSCYCMILYKYLKKERTEPIREFTLRITQPSLLNDPLECLPSMTAPSILGLPPEVANPDDLNNLTAGKKLQDEWSKQIGILCLSESACSTLMWSHYASDHEGYVLGFDSEGETFNPVAEAVAGLGRMTKVTYSEKRFRLGVTGSRHDFSDFSYLFQKSMDWSYESEWRLVLPLDPRNQSSESIYAWEFPPEALCEIVIGFRTPPDLKEELSALRSRFPWTKIRFARPSAINYQMVLEANPTPATISFAS